MQTRNPIWMRGLAVLAPLALLGLVSMPGAPARAAIVTLTGGSLTISTTRYSLPPLTIGAHTGSVFTLTASGGFTEPAGVFGPATVVAPASLMTPIPQISGFTLAAAGNGTVGVTCAGAHCLGSGPLQGKAIINVLQLLNISIPLSVVGRPGSFWQYQAGSILFTVLGEGWSSGTVAISAVTSTTPATAVLHTVTRMGSDARTAAGAGQITLVSGFQAITNVAGDIPFFATQVLGFASASAPEPGVLVLLGSAAAGLALLGRRRMRR